MQGACNLMADGFPFRFHVFSCHEMGAGQFAVFFAQAEQGCQSEVIFFF